MSRQVVASNRRAKFDYEIIDTYEAGMVLLGSEVKSLREGKASINEAYASERAGELWLEIMTDFADHIGWSWDGAGPGADRRPRYRPAGGANLPEPAPRPRIGGA